MGVVSNKWFDCVFTLNSLHVQTLMLTDVQTLVTLQSHTTMRGSVRHCRGADRLRPERRECCGPGMTSRAAQACCSVDQDRLDPDRGRGEVPGPRERIHHDFHAVSGASGSYVPKLTLK